ncbi:PKD domain-containing protein [Patulibacter brassicae]|uniref:PKD domain-containing protein n=1 Tax=Patulibacter brassicae TaxID=1705717 RepID=A0ABU4VK54_9ACTN|nr:PKD domain-containing protein [Patulibacter brassicae]MDX8152183.1 PKD domain-containing protein [Patulibacter brassicae]
MSITHRRRRARLVLLTVVVGAAVSAPAADAADWAHLGPFPFADPITEGRSLGMDRDGRLTSAEVSVLQVMPPVTRARLRVRDDGGPWRDELVVDAGGGRLPLRADVDVAPDGSATACITTVEGADPGNGPRGLLVTRRAPGARTWSAPQLLSTTTEAHPDVARCVAAAADGGRGAVVWGRQATTVPTAVDRRRIIEFADHGPDGAWSAIHALSNGVRDADEPAVAVDDQGATVLAWAERHAGGTTVPEADDRWSIRTATRPAGGAIGATSSLTGPADAGRSGTTPKIATGPGGRAIVTWKWAVGNVLHAWSAMRSSSGSGWEAPEEHGQAANDRTRVLDPVILSDGSAALLYERTTNNVAEDGVGLVRRPAGGAWTALAPVPGTLTVREGALRATPDGRLVALLAGKVGGDEVLRGLTWGPGAMSPTGPASDLLPPRPTPYAEVEAVGDGRGTLVAAVTGDLGDGPRHHLLVRDEGAPVIGGLDVPARVPAGLRQVLRADATDQWSALHGDTPVWDLGDGTRLIGATVQHAWTTPGPKEVTVRVRDAQGNEAVRTATVQVDATTVVHDPPREQPRVVRPKVALTQPACGRRLSAKRCRALRKRTSAWRTLRGTATSATRVEVGVARTTKRRNRVVLLRGKRFRSGTLAASRRTWVRASLRNGRWTLRLPRLAKGTYRVRVRAIGTDGKVASKLLSRTLRLR